MMYTCGKCKTDRSETEYYKNNRPGLTRPVQNWCKSCIKTYMRANVAKVRVYTRRYYQKRKDYFRDYAQRHKDSAKYRARYSLNNAIKRGDVVRGCCEICGATKTEAHHYMGYGKNHWFDVRWLCPLHHKELEGK